MLRQLKMSWALNIAQIHFANTGKWKNDDHATKLTKYPINFNITSISTKITTTLQNYPNIPSIPASNQS